MSRWRLSGKKGVTFSVDILREDTGGSPTAFTKEKATLASEVNAYGEWPFKLIAPQNTLPM